MTNINTVTILGANGTMGRNVGAIFASFGNAKVYMVCRSIEKSKEAIEKAILSVKSDSIKDNLYCATYDDLDTIIPNSDLVFESVAENMSVKKEILTSIYPLLEKNTIVGTGTSGLSIKELAMNLKEKKNNFFGIHMFNPPYNLSLCELVIHDNQQIETSEKIRDYLQSQLNRTVVKVKDSPSFLGNRIGFFFINEAMLLAEKYKDQGGIDYIDSILGSFTGRNMAPLTTADFVGLDVHKSIIDYIAKETHDEFNDYFKSAEYLDYLVAENKLGRKVNCGLYKKDKETNQLYVYDIKENTYRLKINYEFYFANEMINNIKIGDYKKAVDILLCDDSQEALICKRMLLKYIVYSMKIANEVSDDINACDDAMATGFSWLPPIAFIDLFGGKDIFVELVKKYLDSSFVSILTDELINRIPGSSKYNYSPYLKARY